MKLCADCKTRETPSKLHRFCTVCLKKHQAAKVARSNKARSAARKCMCGCGKPAGIKSKYHKECSARIRKEKRAEASTKRSKEMIAEQEQQTERKEQVIVKTAEQVHRECSREEARLREVYPTLNLEMLALRNCRGAIAVVGL